LERRKTQKVLHLEGKIKPTNSKVQTEVQYKRTPLKTEKESCATPDPKKKSMNNIYTTDPFTPRYALSTATSSLGMQGRTPARDG